MKHLTRLLRSCHGIIAVSLLVMMYVLGVTSMAGDTAIVDEVAHIPAAYSYLHFGDYRLNPEHPPLIKDLAAIPLQFMHLNFPNGVLDPWTTEVNGQWDTGWKFLYHSGNDVSAILFWSRLPILLLAVAFGGILYIYMRRRFGISAALLTLFFYTLSPNILASSRYVTTDLGAGIFMFLALIAYIRFAERPTRPNIILLGIALAGAQVVKFSSPLLFPFLLAIAIMQVFTWTTPETRKQRFKTYVGGLMSASILCIGLVWIFYIPHTINMPAEVQHRLINGSLYPSVDWLKGPLNAMANHATLKPLAQYILGLGMVFGRVNGGNTTYFLGEITNGSFKWYFPVLFLLKTQIAFLLLGSIALWAGLVTFARRAGSERKAWVGRVLRDHVTEVVLSAFVIFYFSVSVVGNLDLGIRHILPIYVPLFVVCALAVVRLGRRVSHLSWRRYGSSIAIVLFGWYAGATFWIAPSYTAYFNEIIGGPANADRYFSDSSVDWGQDLLRLRSYIAKHGIKTIALDYFGGAEPRVYFPDEANITLWHSDSGRYSGKYIAISETYLENDRYYAKQSGREGYGYLRAMTPVAKIGYSIYLYKLK